jgi:5'(3')-deoxyribonucleotidase
MRTIYLDMDGVVADFNQFATDFLGRQIGWNENDLTAEEWKQLSSSGDLYAQLPLIEESTQLVAMAKSFSTRFNVEFLTAVPRQTTMPSAKSDKKKWLDKYFPGIKMNIGPFSRDKQNWCKPGDILIDDKWSNIEQWFNKGGIGIFHEGNFKTTINNLVHAVMIEEAVILR